MSTYVISWMGWILLAAPAAAIPAAAGAGPVVLRAHVLEMEGIQWRADLLDGLEFVGQSDTHVVWKADAASLRRLVSRSLAMQPAGTVKGMTAGSGRYGYVASLTRIPTVSNGRTTGLAFRPIVGSVLDGVELDLTGTPAPGGVLADVTIESGELRSFFTATRRDATSDGTALAATFQVPDARHDSVNGRWLIPTRGALVVALHGPRRLEFGGAALRDRVVVIDAGDIPGAVFTPPTSPRSAARTASIARIGRPALLAGLLAGAFLAGWYVRGGVSSRGTRRTAPGQRGALVDPDRVDAGSRGQARRLPRVADLLLMIAATAVACLAVNTSVGPLDLEDFGELLSQYGWDTSWPVLNVVLEIGAWGVILGAPMLAAGSFTLVLVAVRTPAPERSSLVRQPGVIASVQASLAVALAAAFALASYLLGIESDGMQSIVSKSSVYAAGLAGLAVTGSWCTMALIGAWRSEAFWTDRLGRLLGIAWIVMLPFAMIWWLGLL